MIPSKIQHAAALRAEALRLNLRRHPRFDKLTDAELSDIYNGIGPDAWPPLLRDLMTDVVFCDLELLPFVHDVDFAFSDGTAAGLADSTARWLANGHAVIADRYPLWKPWLLRSRARAWAKVLASYEALRLYSGPAWIDACKRRKT